MTLDLNVVLAAEDLQAATAAAEAIGFSDVSGWLPLPSGAIGIDRLFRLSKLAGESCLPLDFLIADSRENRVLRDREMVEISGRHAAVLTRSVLTRMKSALTRSKDKLDVESLADDA